MPSIFLIALFIAASAFFIAPCPDSVTLSANLFSKYKKCSYGSKELITLCFFFLTSCQNLQNIENTKKKSLNKEFTISSETKLKTNK